MADYARTGWQNARTSDERDQIHDIVTDTPYKAVREAAKAAYKGDAAQVHAFVETGQHQAAFTDYQVEASRIAQNSGPGVKQAAADALNAGTPKALVDFLTTGQYTARETDDRVLAAQLAQNGGAEVKAAAEAALVSPPNVLRTFIESGQFQAQRQDQLIAAHLSQVAQAISEVADIAARARQSASEALRVYALARSATAEADKYAAQARTDAADAATAAQHAREAADKAEASAKKAAEHAKTANQARQRATDSANQAADSAVWAQSSATAAATSAAKAYATAAAAQIVAEQAGKDAKSVNEIFQNALAQAKAAQFQAQYGPGWNPVMLSALPPYMRGVIAFNNLPIDQKLKVAIQLAHLELDLLSSLPIVGVPAAWPTVLATPWKPRWVFRTATWTPRCPAPVRFRSPGGERWGSSSRSGGYGLRRSASPSRGFSGKPTTCPPA
ncbi:ALF repeat-containing protein [Kitasatospora arboriphila]